MLRSSLLLLSCLLSLQVFAVEPAKLVDGARQQVGVTLAYDPVYRASITLAVMCRWRPVSAPMW